MRGKLYKIINQSTSYSLVIFMSLLRCIIDKNKKKHDMITIVNH